MTLQEKLSAYRHECFNRKLDNETDLEHDKRMGALALQAELAIEKEYDRWTAHNAVRNGLSLDEIERAADILARHPDLTVIDVLRVIGVEDHGGDILIPVEGRYRDVIEDRAKRLRVSLQNLTLDEIAKLSVNFLVSVIDNERSSVKDRLKAVEVLGKLVRPKPDESEKTESTETVQVYVQELRKNLLGIGSEE